jgi:hypothetical protein
MRKSGWTRTEGKDRDGYRKFIWWSTVNPDITIEVSRQSLKVERVGPQAVNVIYFMKGTPQYKKHLGYYVTFKRKGDQTLILGGQIKHWSDKKKKWNVKAGKGPWTQEEAMQFAYHHLTDQNFLKNYVSPRQYNIEFPVGNEKKDSSATST